MSQRRGDRSPLLVVVNDLVQVVVLALDDADDEEPGFVFELGEGLGVGRPAALGLNERVLDGFPGRVGRALGRRDIGEGVEAILFEADDRVGGHGAERAE